MDKQKQIEEMAKTYCQNGFKCDDNCQTNGCRVYEVCTELYTAGYRKIPENAVVLTGVSFENNEGKTLFTAEDWKFSEQLKPMTFTSKEPLSEEAYEGAKALCMKHCELLPECQKQVIKETAEKFAEMVSKAFVGLNCIDIDEWNWCQQKIDEICKEITEGKV